MAKIWYLIFATFCFKSDIKYTYLNDENQESDIELNYFQTIVTEIQRQLI